MRQPRNGYTAVKNHKKTVPSLVLFSIGALLGTPSTHAQSSSTLDNKTTASEQLAFYNPTERGGSWLTTWNEATRGEPLNVVVSGNSDPSILEYDGFIDWSYSLSFSPQCFHWYDEGAQQAADLKDGNGLRNQTTILRYNYQDPIFGACGQSLQGGEHFRVFRQNGTEMGTGAWFLAASKEHNLGKKHMILPNGYDLGRDEIVSLATNPRGTRSPVSKALYSTSVKAVQGPTYFGDLRVDEINHGIMIDGRIAVLTVSVLEKGDGSKPLV
ncbi:uncharacterized protein JCM6883_000004 [Sporobolomyces salmoneus]|uniref:uncharacterized protein n=1 Tax=Sporobolomyces salmoneus TaxID=183962 RepID=UPI00316B01B0